MWSSWEPKAWHSICKWTSLPFQSLSLFSLPPFFPSPLPFLSSPLVKTWSCCFRHSFIQSPFLRSLDSNREPVSDASAVYFIIPDHSTINRICRDLNSHIYDSYYFNFITPISRPMLEELAKTTVDTNNVSDVTKVLHVHVIHYGCNVCYFSFIFAQVFDQYVNFISLEENFFVCRHQGKKEISFHGI